jgi:hypothetical protein
MVILQRAANCAVAQLRSGKHTTGGCMTVLACKLSIVFRYGFLTICCILS